MAAILMTIDNQEIEVESGNDRIINCEGKVLSWSKPPTIMFGYEGWYEYGGFITVCKAGQTKTLPCVGLIMTTNLILHAYPYGSSLPKPVSSEDKMAEILSNATEDQVGAVYKYTGPTTETYERGALYTITKE